MASSSFSSAVSVTREEFKAFHKIDRSLFTRLIINLRRDIRQSLQVMSFFFYLEQNGLAKNLIMNLVSSPDHFINAVADEVMLCTACLSYVEYSSFVADYARKNNLYTIPLITQMTGDYLTLQVISRNRDNIILEMTKYLNSICYPALEDIGLHAKIYTKEMEKAMEKMSQMGISRVVDKAESSSHFLLRAQQATTNNVAEDGQVNADDRTIFLTFSKGYPISEAEVHAYFTRRYGEIIEAIEMGVKEGNEQVLFAKMILHSAAKVSEIVQNGGDVRTKFTINGKHVWARKYIPRSSNYPLPPSYGLSL